MQRFERATEFVLAGSLARGERELMSHAPLPRDEETADAVRDLVAIKPPPGEAEKTRDMAAMRFETTPVRIATRTLRRRITVLKPTAAPGASGWRNLHVVLVSEARGGAEALRAWCQCWADGVQLQRETRLRAAAVLEATDGGPAVQPEPGETTVGAHGRKSASDRAVGGAREAGRELLH